MRTPNERAGEGMSCQRTDGNSGERLRRGGVPSPFYYMNARLHLAFHPRDAECFFLLAKFKKVKILSRSANAEVPTRNGSKNGVEFGARGRGGNCGAANSGGATTARIGRLLSSSRPFTIQCAAGPERIHLSDRHQEALRARPPSLPLRQASELLLRRPCASAPSLGTWHSP
jgi:hypothetical protein